MNLAISKPVKVSSKGQLTLPKKFREKYKINTNCRIRFMPMKDGIKLLISEPADIENFCGFIKADGPQDFDAIIHDVKMRRANENY